MQAGKHQSTGLQVLIAPGQGQSLEQVVDNDIEAFTAYFCNELKNEGLSRPERAILKTYLYFKTVVAYGEKPEQKQAGSESG